MDTEKFRIQIKEIADRINYADVAFESFVELRYGNAYCALNFLATVKKECSYWDKCGKMDIQSADRLEHFELV